MRAAWFPLLFVGCGPKAPVVADEAPVAAPEPGPPSAPVLPHDRTTSARMHTLLHLVETARDRVVRGDLDGARASGGALAVEPLPPGLDPAWTPFVAETLAEAERLSTAPNLDQAAAVVARVGLACGSCHVETSTSDEVKLDAVPDDPGRDNRMGQHQWASDWMWMGLVTGDHNLYTLGAGAFVAEQRPPVDPALLRDAELASMLASVDGAARDAIAATDDDARAARYGHLLATCARCHAALGRGGPAE